MAMRVRYDRMAGQSVHCGMDEQGRGLDLMPPFDDAICIVHKNDVVRLHFTPVQTAGIEQETVLSDGYAEMIADALGESMYGCCSQCQSKVFLKGRTWCDGPVQGHASR
jgi:DNA-directed RNA polymerase subunit RPC12/RpoP